jgi:hypothetical protein
VEPSGIIADKFNSRSSPRTASSEVPIGFRHKGEDFRVRFNDDFHRLFYFGNTPSIFLMIRSAH